MLKKEGVCLAHMLSLGLGIVMLIGEVAFYTNVIRYTFTYGTQQIDAMFHTTPFIVATMISVTVI